MIFKVQYVVNCSWEDEKVFEKSYYYIKSFEELAEESLEIRRKALHYIYKTLESPLYMTEEVSPLLEIRIYENKSGIASRDRYYEKRMRRSILKDRLSRTGHWRVA